MRNLQKSDTGFNLLIRKDNIFKWLDVAPATRRDYSYRASMFIDYVQRQGLHTNTFLEFKDYLRTYSNASISTKNKYLTVARILLKEAYRLGYMPNDITTNIKAFNESRQHKKTGFSEQEIKAISQYINGLVSSAHTPIQQETALRIQAMYQLLASSGLRQIEVVRLSLSDIDYIQSCIMVQGKGRDDKEPIYIPDSTAKAIQSYTRASGHSSGQVFRGIGRRRREGITTATIKRTFAPIFRALGISGSVHGFRHYFVTSLLGEFDIRDVRKFSRHRSLDMLIVYDDEITQIQKMHQLHAHFEQINVT